MTRAVDVVVVGSGIVGLGAAYAAVRRGLSVVVVDRASEPIGATVRNFGHLCFTPQSGEARRYGVAARQAWLRLAAEAGLWLRESGTLVVARHQDELELLRAAAAVEHPVDERLGEEPEVRLLDADELLRRAPVRPGEILGGAHLPFDLQTDPRAAAAAIVRHLADRGVDFRFRTAVGRVASGRVETSRGPIDAGSVVVAVNHDLDQLLPELAERYEVERCGLDMLRVDAGLAAPLTAPLLTGWSLIRYRAFAELPAAAAVRERLHAARPELAAMDLNQMYTQLPDGSLIVGDSHRRGASISPFQSEVVADALLEETERLFATSRPRVVERWQGVYASAPAEFLVDSPEPGVLALAATTGIGMTTGLGLAEHGLAQLVGPLPVTTLEGIL